MPVSVTIVPDGLAGHQASVLAMPIGQDMPLGPMPQ
jgi:hypothetical protein